MGEYKEQVERNQQEDRQAWADTKQGVADTVDGAISGMQGIADGAKQLGDSAVETAQGVPAAADHAAAQIAKGGHDAITSVPVVGAVVGAASGAMLTAGDGIAKGLNDLGSKMQQASEDNAKQYAERVRQQSSTAQTGPNGIEQQEGHADRQLADEPESASGAQAETQLEA